MNQVSLAKFGIQEAVNRCRDSEGAPVGVIGVVPRFLEKNSKLEGRQGCKISLEPISCRLIGLFVQTSKRMKVEFRDPGGG